jgi:hypothetical protein
MTSSTNEERREAQEQKKALLIHLLVRAQYVTENLILDTPSGPTRNLLCDINIFTTASLGILEDPLVKQYLQRPKPVNPIT